MEKVEQVDKYVTLRYVSFEKVERERPRKPEDQQTTTTSYK